MTKRQQVEQAIREACPELKDAIETEGRNGYCTDDAPIHLEHLLRAVGNLGDTCRAIACANTIHFSDSYFLHQYNLSLPFDDQSDELINFLHSILCGKE